MLQALIIIIEKSKSSKNILNIFFGPFGTKIDTRLQTLILRTYIIIYVYTCCQLEIFPKMWRTSQKMLFCNLKSGVIDQSLKIIHYFLFYLMEEKSKRLIFEKRMLFGTQIIPALSVQIYQQFNTTISCPEHQLQV